MGRPKSESKPVAGFGALVQTMRHTLQETGIARGVQNLRHVNQDSGFDCPGCAWPDPEKRSLAEFCENGAKHVAHEATRKRIGAEFFASWPVSKLYQQSDHWLEQQGRLTEPLCKPAGSDYYERISWEDALERLAVALCELESPHEAVFYTSGRTSNEAAFLYQLFAREFGTNNLPDCSHMCHESSGTALTEVIGTGKGTVSLADFEHADAILILGQNPGSNHPRMLTTLQAAKRRGCKIISINPIRERGLVSFANPKELQGLLGRGTPISDLFLQIRVGGDGATLKGIMKELLEMEQRAPGIILDRVFIDHHTENFDDLQAHLQSLDWSEIETQSGLERAEIRAAAEIYATAKRVIACWAMGLTQHRHAVANIQDIVNLLLFGGNIGIEGAGVCPVRGHSNVQGDRTVGITQKPKPAFLDRLSEVFGFEPPRDEGLNTVDAIRAMQERRVKVFIALGGNFVAATPDTAYTEEALRQCKLTVQVSTKLNRSHLVTGREALILPCLGRTERDLQNDQPQFVTVENSMSVVHRSQGHLDPVSDEVRSEPAIVAGIARAVFGDASNTDWDAMRCNYDVIRERIADVVPGFDDFNARVSQSVGFVLPSGARTRAFETASGKAAFTKHPLHRLEIEADQYLLMTIRSHNQFNTTIYGLDDRYRGVHGDRHVIFMNERDIAERGFHEGQALCITSHFRGETRSLSGFRIFPYALPSRCTAAYFPEANGLVPLGSTAEKSHTPTYKSIVVTLDPVS